MFTDIKSASELVDVYLQNKNSPYYRYFVFQGSVVKILNKEYSKAYELIDLCENLDLSGVYEGHLQNNKAVLFNIVNEEMNKNKNGDFFKQNKFAFSCEGFDSYDTIKETRENVKMLKKAVKYYINNENTESTDDLIKTNTFLDSEAMSYDDKHNEDVISNIIKQPTIIKTITNITEILFMISNDESSFIKDSGFWLKSGLLRHPDAQRYLPRHLVIAGLVYSQLGQTMIAEGMYRQALEFLKDDIFVENKANFSLGLNMYGRLLLRDPNRKDEAQNLITQSENIEYFDWYKTLTKLHYFDMEFI